MKINLNSKKILIMLSVLFIINIVVAVSSAGMGGQLSSIESKSQKLALENQELEEKIIASQSLSKIAESASLNGLVKPDKILYLARTGDNSVAQR